MFPGLAIGLHALHELGQSLTLAGFLPRVSFWHSGQPGQLFAKLTEAFGPSVVGLQFFHSDVPE